MNALSTLFVWANMPYMIAFAIAVIFALLQMTGVLGLLVGDADHDADHDVDADADHDIDADADADHDVDADGDQDADHDADNDHNGGVGGKILLDLGVGRIPFSTLWQTFAITFGIAGLAVNSLVLAPRGELAPSALVLSIPLSFVVAYVVTRTLARVLGRMLSGEHEEASSRKDLIGSTGTVISSQVTSEFGEIRITDQAGRFMHVICRIREAETTIPMGKEVVVVDYDAQTGHIFVSPLDLDSIESKPKRLKSTVQVVAKKTEVDDALAEAEADEALQETRKKRKS